MKELSYLGVNVCALVKCYAGTCWAAGGVMDGCRGEDSAIQCRTKGLPRLRLNVSHNLKIASETLLGLLRPLNDMASRAEIRFEVFSVQSCSRLARPDIEGPLTENVLRDLSRRGASQCDAITDPLVFDTACRQVVHTRPRPTVDTVHPGAVQVLCSILGFAFRRCVVRTRRQAYACLCWSWMAFRRLTRYRWATSSAYHHEVW